MNIHKNARLNPLRREEMAVAVLRGTLTSAPPPSSTPSRPRSCRAGLSASSRVGAPKCVSRVLKRAGLSRMRNIAPAEAAVRYE
jgi:hypothetical protein